MSAGRVLVIEDDEAVARLLATCLRRASYEVETAGDAQEGWRKAQRIEPDCIVCDVNLPGTDGFWVAKQVRDQRGALSSTPFLFLTALDDERSRMQGFGVGGDVYMTKPFRIAEVVAQIGALVQMAKRVRQRIESVRPSDTGSEPTALRGDLALMSLATVLTVLDMERRSGRLVVRAAEQRAEIELAAGCATRATLGDEELRVVDLVRALLAWKQGSFAFRPGPEAPPPEPRVSLGAVLLEALRLEDEENRPGEEPEPRSLELALELAPAPEGERDTDPDATPLVPEATLAALEIDVELEEPPASDAEPLSWSDVVAVDDPDEGTGS